MAFDGFITKSIIEEMKPHLIGGKVDKISQPTKNDVVIKIYNMGTNYALELCANPETCRIGLTTHPKPNPQNAPNFCMLLRKYLSGAKLIDISNMDLERTVLFKFETYNEFNELVVRKIFVEIMSRQSNIILTDENNTIIDALRRISSENKEVLPSRKFNFTPINKESFVNISNFDEFKEIYSNSKFKSISQFMTYTFIGFSKPLILNALQTLNIADENASDSDLERFYNHIKEMIASFGTSNISCKKYEKDYCLALLPTTQNLAINFFIDDYYYEKETANNFTTSRNNLLKIMSATLKKVSKKLENINSKLEECSNMDTYRLYGELLTANLYKFKDSPNVDSIELENYYDNNNLIKIPLDKSMSIRKNIDKYFKKYNKLKNALNIVTEQKLDTERELDYIQSIVFSIENAKNLSDITEVFEEISENIVTKKEIAKKVKNKQSKKKPKETEITFEPILIDRYQVYIGKNNIQNDYLSLKFADKNDYWFHTQKIHGSHVILRTNGNTDVPDEVLTKCAELAKQNSKAANSSNVPIDFCLARYVKKASGAKPGMVIYTNYKTIYIR